MAAGVWAMGEESVHAVRVPTPAIRAGFHLIRMMHGEALPLLLQVFTTVSTMGEGAWQKWHRAPLPHAGAWPPCPMPAS